MDIYAAYLRKQQEQQRYQVQQSNQSNKFKEWDEKAVEVEFTFIEDKINE